MRRPTEMGRTERFLHGRWIVAAVFGCAFVLYVGIINGAALDGNAAIRLNDATWTLFGLAASAVCFAAANKLVNRERLAWLLIALGCLFWSTGQFAWDYYELARGKLPAFPHWMQGLFLSYPILLVAGLLTFPKPSGVSRMTVRHGGNLGLIGCTVVIVLVIAITEPAVFARRSVSSLAITLMSCLAYATACMTALYLLWSYRWQSAYWPLVLIAIGSGIHTSAYVTDVHGRFTGTYRPNDWVNGAWLIALASVACGAYEYVFDIKHHPPKASAALLRRERFLEATMPALLILVMVGTVISNAEWISARVIYLCASIGVAFAVALGIREAWIQREEQRLVAALSESNRKLSSANRDLTESEQRYRTLNVELERRVTERTQKLQHAYRELESFSYAVAHDLKSPLRAMDGFGALLAEEYGAQLDEQGRAYIARMRRGAITMARLVDDLLAYARIDRRETQIETVNIATLVNHCISEQRDDIARANIAVNAEVNDADMAIDREGLTIALRNVLQNAIKFSSGAAAPQIELHAAHADPHRLRLSIRDNGIGFDMEYHDRIFAMFQRLHRADTYPGTGIGLALAHKAIERAGGRIWAESAPGAGATFFIEMPLP